MNAQLLCAQLPGVPCVLSRQEEISRNAGGGGGGVLGTFALVSKC